MAVWLVSGWRQGSVCQSGKGPGLEYLVSFALDENRKATHTLHQDKRLRSLSKHVAPRESDRVQIYRNHGQRLDVAVQVNPTRSPRPPLSLHMGMLNFWRPNVFQ